MLNSALVEQFAAINRQKKSGVLTVVGADTRLRFCFHNGDPVGVDFCTDKDLVFADTLLEFHKIGADLHQMLVESRRLGKGSVVDMVRRQQVVNEDEIGQITRATVEDTLVRCFSGTHQEVLFDENDGQETFDFDASAVRLRIGTPVLLSTVQARVAEIERVAREAGGGDAVFTLSESESGSAPLSDFEKHVLNFIDGRKTTADIAVAFRESTQNMARLLHGMMGKGVIRRAQGNVARIKQATAAQQQPQEPLAIAGGSSSASRPATASQLEPAPVYVSSRDQGGGNRTTLVMLGIGLALAIGVVVLVRIGQARSEALDSATSALADNIAAGRWNEAVAQIEQARASAGNDLEAHNRVVALDQRLAASLDVEHQLLSRLLDEQDFPKVHERIDRLPPSERVIELRRRLNASEDAFRRRAEALIAEVEKLLDAGNTTQALQLIARNPGRDGQEANRFLERWRLSSLERAGSASLPLSQRTALINQILATNPTDHQREQVARIRGDFARIQQRTVDALGQLAKLAEKGAYAEVLAEWERLRIGDQVRGTDLADKADKTMALVERARAELVGLQDQADALIHEGDDAKAMAGFGERVQKALVAWPQASNAAQLRASAQLLTEISGLVSERNANEEAIACDAWVQERQPGPDVARLITMRAARLRSLETAAQESLDVVRAYIRQNEWELAQRGLNDLIARSEWRRTAAHAAAKRDLAESDNLRAQQQAWQEDLRSALLRGDSAAGYQIAQKMGLKYLPLVIRSQPDGAEVWRDGAKLGATPFILDIPAGERGSLSLEVRKQGFTSRVLSGADAEGGWLLHAGLERVSVARFDLNMTVTAKPIALDGKLWLANRQLAAVVVPGAKPERIEFGANGAELGGQPLYAAPAAIDGQTYLATRDGIAIKITGKRVERIPLAGRSDMQLAAAASQLVAGRRMLLVAGLDGVLHASDERDPAVNWKGSSGEPFACAPVVRGDRVWTVRRNGRIEVHHVDDGQLIAQHEVGGQVLAVWVAGEALRGLTRTAHWTFDGAAPQSKPLPQEASAGGEGVFLTPDNHAWIIDGAEWKDLGRFEGRATGEPLAWNRHAVLVQGATLVVVGPQGFRLTGGAEFLPPARIGDRLAVTTLAGQVVIYAP